MNCIDVSDIYMEDFLQTQLRRGGLENAIMGLKCRMNPVTRFFFVFFVIIWFSSATLSEAQTVFPLWKQTSPLT